MSRRFRGLTGLHGSYVSLSIRITGKFCGSPCGLGSILEVTHWDSIGPKLTIFQKLYDNL